MTLDEQKKIAAYAAVKAIQSEDMVGVGTGSTVYFFVEALAEIKGKISGTVASSVKTAEWLKAKDLPVYELTSVDQVNIYVDGADEISYQKQLIKGGGGALTREKILAASSQRFICIADHSKYHISLGQSPIPVEIIPMARSYVARELIKLGGEPRYRQGYITDNGNCILDVYHLNLDHPIALEEQLNNIVGIVCHGLFAKQRPELTLLGQENGEVLYLSE